MPVRLALAQTGTVALALALRHLEHCAQLLHCTALHCTHLTALHSVETCNNDRLQQRSLSSLCYVCCIDSDCWAVAVLNLVRAAGQKLQSNE